jgi:hypothetical protein
MAEVDRYFEKTRTTSAHDVGDLLQWWHQHKDAYPGLYRVAMELAVIPASSAACEREFSRAGRYLTELRSRMAAHTLRSVMMCGENMLITERVLGVDAQSLADFKMARRGARGNQNAAHPIRGGSGRFGSRLGCLPRAWASLLPEAAPIAWSTIFMLTYWMRLNETMLCIDECRCDFVILVWEL